MASQIFTTSVLGIDAVQIEAQAQIVDGKRRFAIVGLPDGVLRESRERVRCAVENSGYSFPSGDVIVSLSPAALPKAGSGYDLAIGLSVLGAAGYLKAPQVEKTIFFGELSLRGEIRPAAGILASACFAASRGWTLVSCPEALPVTEQIPNLKRISVRTLTDVVRWLNMPEHFVPAEIEPTARSSGGRAHTRSFRDVIGQDAAKRAITIAAAGGHNLFLVGPPGAGKSMVASRMPAILPALEVDEAIEVAKIRGALSAQSESGCETLCYVPPFRSPHHTTSCAGLIGGGSFPRPGEISLAHRGVLFLDELLEFRRDTLEALRQPMEERRVVVSRAQFRIAYPADFLLIAAANPCPCGHLGSSRACECAIGSVQRYRQRLSGPMLDRIDLQVWVSQISVAELQRQQLQEDPTGSMQRSVIGARDIQCRRREAKSQRALNASLAGDALRSVCDLNEESKRLLERAAAKLQLTARGYTRVLRVARTIADLERAEKIALPHLTEALSYRIAEWGAR